MEDFTDKQNEAFKNIFGEIKKRPVNCRSDALTMLKLNDENFTTLFTDNDNEITGDAEDVELCNQRAIHLGIKK